MIQVHDNMFSPFYFGYLLRYVEMNKFQTVNVGGKDFTILNPKEEIIRAFVERISVIEKRPIELVLGFSDWQQKTLIQIGAFIRI